MKTALFGISISLALLAGPAFGQASCNCEHFASPYDGLCAAYPNTGNETYEWHTWGAAYLPYPPSPTLGMAIYDVAPQGCRGGLEVVVIVNGTPLPMVRCLHGTGGAHC